VKNYIFTQRLFMKQSKIVVYTLLTLCAVMLNGCVGDGSNSSNLQSDSVNNRTNPINNFTNNTIPTPIGLASSATPCTNHSCTQYWSLDTAPQNTINLRGQHYQATCNQSATIAPDSSGKKVITLTDYGNKNTCYVIISGVFSKFDPRIVKQTHIYLEADILLPKPNMNPNGIWPAFWTDIDSNWPHGGEIDIAEGNVNSKFTRLETWTNLHGSGGANQGPSQQYNFSGLTDFDNWHTYGLEVLTNSDTMHIEIRTYLDGNQMTSFNNDNASGEDIQDYIDIINGFYTHNIVFDTDDNHVSGTYTMNVKNLNAYIVN
jgi:hypothetical protein